MKIKVGDVVLINELGHSRYGVSKRNPKNVSGIVTHLTKSCVYVTWDNGETNSYLSDTLTVITGLENE